MVHRIPRRAWYVVMLFLPILLPAGLWAISAITSHPASIWPLYDEARRSYDSYAAFIYDRFAVMFLFQLWLGGVPYLLFAVAVLWWGRNKTATQMWWASWSLPFLFFVCLLPIALIDMSLAGIFIVLSIPFGYFYVLLAHGLTCLFARTGIVEGGGCHA